MVKGRWRSYCKANQREGQKRKTWFKVDGWWILNWTWGIWMWERGEREPGTEQSGHLSWGKPRLNLMDCSAKEEEGTDFRSHRTSFPLGVAAALSVADQQLSGYLGFHARQRHRLSQSQRV